MVVTVGNARDNIREVDADWSTGISGPVISAETCRVCEMVLDGSKLGESAPGKSETACAKGRRPPELVKIEIPPELFSKACSRGNSRNQGVARGTGENQQVYFP